MLCLQETTDDDPSLTPINLHILRNLWLPDVEILDLKAFETHSVLSKLEGRSIFISVVCTEQWAAPVKGKDDNSLNSQLKLQQWQGRYRDGGGPCQLLLSCLTEFIICSVSTL